MPDVTEEQHKENAKEFLKEYGVLVEKHKMDFVAFPVFVPNGNGKFEVEVQSQLVSTANRPVKSPFIAN